MTFTSILVEAIRFVFSCAKPGRIRASGGPQTEALAAAIEVEIWLNSWRARHQPSEQEASGRFGGCPDDRSIPTPAAWRGASTNGRTEGRRGVSKGRPSGDALPQDATLHEAFLRFAAGPGRVGEAPAQAVIIDLEARRVVEATEQG